jgi:type II secretory pathway pseudopilin PulG
MKKTFKVLKEKQDAMQQQQAQQKQQELDQQNQQAQATLQQAQQQHDQDNARLDYQAELDRVNKKEIALIAAESKGNTLPDVNQDSVPDVLEISKLTNEQNKAARDYQLKMADIMSKASQNDKKMEIEREKLKVARENQINDVQVARINASNRASKKK